MLFHSCAKASKLTAFLLFALAASENSRIFEKKKLQALHHGNNTPMTQCRSCPECRRCGEDTARHFFLQNPCFTIWVMKLCNEEMGEPEKYSGSIKDRWIKLSATRKMEHGIRGVNPHSGRCMRFTFRKRKGLCESSAIVGVFGCDEGFDSLAKVAIQPIRHVFWLRKPRFGFESLIQISNVILNKNRVHTTSWK